MTELQFNEIKERLSKWREERRLTYENQQAGFLGNVFEEISEYFRAKDNLERVDALFDIAVFCFNAFQLKFGEISNIKRASMFHLIDHFTSYFLEHNNKTVYNNSKDEDFEYLFTASYDDRQHFEDFINKINSSEIKVYYEYLKESLKEDHTYPIYFTDIFDEFTPDKVSQITKKQMMLEM